MMRDMNTKHWIRVWRMVAVAIVAVMATLVAWSATAHAQWKGKVTTANGVTTVANPAKPYGQAATVKLPELWRLGGDTDDEEEFFGVISDIDIDEKGDVYLLDSQLNEVKVYSKDGEFLRSIGREGEGPGEFRNPSSMFFTKDGKVAVVQMMPGKIVQLTRDGQPAGDHPIPQDASGGFQLVQGAEARGGNLTLFMGRQNFDQAAGKWSRRSFLASVDPAGKQVCEYASKENVINMAAAELNDAAWDTFERRWEVGPDGKVYSCNSYENYEITVYDRAGKIDRVVTREYTHLTRPEKEKKFMTTVMTHYTKMMPPGSKVKIADMSKDVENLYVRDDGSIWVLPSSGNRDLPKGTMGVFDVFNPEGHYVKQVTLQGQGDPREDLFVFEKDRLYVVTSFVQAAMTAQGVQGLYDAADEPEPMAVICYKLEGDVIAAR